MAYAAAGKRVLITGASAGLGAALARRLAARNAVVGLIARRRDRLADVLAECRRTSPASAMWVADLADTPALSGLALRAWDSLGGIDVLVNNAAIYPSRPWTEISEDEWDAVLAINLKGYFLCAQAAFPLIEARGAGRIVNLTSTTVFHSFPNATVLDYVSSKAAIVGFTRQLAREVGARGVTVNAVAPGAFEQGDAPAEYEQWVLAHQSIKRRGVGSDVGNAVVFLASDAASFITGQTLVVDGGMATP